MITKVYVWSIPVVTLDTVAKNRLYLESLWKSQRVVPGNIQEATSNFILIIWKTYQFVLNWTEHSVQFAQGKYIQYFNNYDWISTIEQILKSLFYYII